MGRPSVDLSISFCLQYGQRTLGDSVVCACFGIAPAQIGYHNENHRSWVHAITVEAWGKILSDCGRMCAKICLVLNIGATMFTVVRPMTAAQPKRIICHQYDTRRNDFLRNGTFVCIHESALKGGRVLVATKRIMPRLSGLQCNFVNSFPYTYVSL